MKKITLAVMAALFTFGVVASSASAMPAQVKPRGTTAVTEIATDAKKAPAKKKTAKKKGAPKKTAKKAGKGAAA
jgi:hypothetical protein